MNEANINPLSYMDIYKNVAYSVLKAVMEKYQVMQTCSDIALRTLCERSEQKI